VRVLGMACSPFAERFPILFIDFREISARVTFLLEAEINRPSPRTGRRSTQAPLRGRTSLDGDLTGSAGSPRRRAGPSPTTSEGAAESVVLRDAECALSPMRSRTARRSLQIFGSRVLGR